MKIIDAKNKGIIGIYKPKGISSHRVISILRKITGVKKIGHAGTLDPLAEGVLVIGIGRDATKQLSTEVAKEKEYVATFMLGVESSTDDAEGIKETIPMTHMPSKEEITEALHSFIGNILQTPPLYSAVKINGREAYKYARKGHFVELKPRPVYVRTIEVLSYKWPNLKLRIVTGPGVYIRSLARDLGKKLHTGAYMSGLERTRVGDFKKNTVYHLPEEYSPSTI